MFRIMTKLSDAMIEVSAFLARVLVLFVGASMLMQVILRYIFRAALPWPEEAARYAMIWLVCLCGNILIRNEELITVDFLDKLWPRKMIKYRNGLYRLLLLVVLFVLIREGINQTILGGTMTSTALGIERFWPYLSVPVGAVLMFYQMVYIIIRDFVAPKKEISDNERITTQLG
jgi:TRAP-type C4-dicarboxylate transport system permease small subunit